MDDDGNLNGSKVEVSVARLSRDTTRQATKYASVRFDARAIGTPSTKRARRTIIYIYDSD